jgi:hypothetical protein
MAAAIRNAACCIWFRVKQVRRVFFTAIVLTLVGCRCLFVPCYKAVHVSGHVLDEANVPIENASVQLFGDTRATGADGCFRYQTTTEISLRFGVAVTRTGFKPYYANSQRCADYDITVRLARNSSSGASIGKWRNMSEYEVQTDSQCPAPATDSLHQ